ncbi:MAG: SDR family oxidoreductase [Acidimicrobiia bacterium]|nr:SDR family oxidoreductase [Acidimicrobiia bacterium]
MALPAPSPDRTCIVTGASSGIGAAIARRLAGLGHGVTLVARRVDRLQVLAGELAERHGIRAEVVATDLTDEQARSAILGEVEGKGLVAAALVNNAGLSTTGPVRTADVAAELGMIRTDVEAVAHLTTLVLPGMVERGAGSVLNVASTAAFQPLPGQAGYAACKAFVLSYTLAVRTELEGTGVSATALCPGPVKTEFVEQAGFTADEAAQAMPGFMWVSPEAVAQQAVDGMLKGRAIVTPGLANKVSAVAGRVVPRALLLPILARQHPALRR